MHVLYVIGGKGQRYGSEVVAERLITYLSEEYNVNFTVVVNAKGVISELCEAKGIECHVVKIRPYVYAKHKNTVVNSLKKLILLARARLDDWIAIRKLEKKIDFSKIDIVHTNLSRNMLGAKISRKYRIPHIWYIQEMFDAHYKLNFLMNNQIEYMNMNSDIFIGISETVSNDWIRHGISSMKFHTVLNGVEEGKGKKPTDFGRDKYKIAMIAEITPPKGQDFVIDAIATLSEQELSGFTIDLIGGGKERYIESLKEKVKENGLDNVVRFLGQIENACRMLSSYDILINASDGEGFGLSTAEAMMNMVCPLVSDRGANVELVEDRVTGVVFKKEDKKEDFLEALHYLMNANNIETISLQAYEYARNNFSISRQISEVYDLYSALSRM